MEQDKNPAKDLSNSGSTWRDYANIVSHAQGYQLDEAQLGRVAAQLELIGMVAAPLLALQLPAELEPAPVFRP
ncbi:MAG: hypothetical protein JWN23_2638 [Rhodocyclales bacterium]|nr:hypothetical protein [Rhodocyclales bacterium]